MPISWRRLWLQIGDPVLVTSPTEMRRELADIWAAAHAASQLGHGVDVVCARAPAARVRAGCRLAR
ncbi:hypothetical protein [Aeromicrobium sp. UC242_57]|uniref:hypothetical protein n=1 Tax=Aeromicrobium sp. UC242_57 TaxID=3374624 RepID=UPI0037C03AA0